MNNNNVKPTCKAVVRPNQRGARIHPRGCRVRYRVQGDGTLGKVAKATNQLKPAKRTILIEGDNHFRFHVRVGDGERSQFLWDTGATYTSMNRRTARRLGILGANNTPINGFVWSGSHNTEIADGTLVQVRRISNVPLTFVRYGETVRGTVQIMPDETASSLFGISHIRNVRTLKVKNK